MYKETKTGVTYPTIGAALRAARWGELPENFTLAKAGHTETHIENGRVLVMGRKMRRAELGDGDG